MRQPMTFAEQAVFHIYRRVQSSADFSWLMLGSESLAICIKAVAEYRGESEQEVREHIFAKAASVRETPELCELRQRVADLERNAPRRAAGCADGPLDEFYGRLARVEDLCRLAELGVEPLTPEAVREAMSPRQYC